MIELKPFDILTVDGLWYMPHHHLIQWRELDDASHCVVITDEAGIGYSPEFSGIKVRDIFAKYKDRNVQIHRYKHELDKKLLRFWCGERVTAKYDFWGQWILGCVFGLGIKSISDDAQRFTCSEFAYWLFQENGYKLTSVDEVLPMPRLFRYHNDFELVYSGKL